MGWAACVLAQATHVACSAWGLAGAAAAVGMRHIMFSTLFTRVHILLLISMHGIACILYIHSMRGGVSCRPTLPTINGTGLMLSCGTPPPPPHPPASTMILVCTAAQSLVGLHNGN